MAEAPDPETHGDGAATALGWVDDPTEELVGEQQQLGRVVVRRLLQMRRPLPFAADEARPEPADTRAFRPGEDDEAWLDVNNEAFGWHPEQGGWTPGDLRDRMAEPWFDAEDFRIATADGAMTGFCWTKVHRELDPPEGEIFVIAVAPGRARPGFGSALVVAGLESLWDRYRTPFGMLYVESTNERAIATYERLGFGVQHTRVLFGAEP